MGYFDASGSAYDSEIWVDVADLHLSAEFLESIEAELVPGNCAVAAEISEEWITPLDVRMEALHTPGHTAGDICLHDRDRRILFSGDTVFPSSPTENILADADKKLGSMDHLIASLGRLVPYEVDFLLPGHGVPAFSDGDAHILNAYLETRKAQPEEDERRPYLDAARMLTEAGRPEKALECYNVALQLDPGDFEALIFKGTTLTELQHYDEALAIFDRVLKQAPEIEEAVTGKGFALLGLGRVQEALELPGFAARLKQML